jgi:hypothetical protein
MSAGYRVMLCASVLILCALGGCSSKSEFEFDALDLAPPEEEMTEFSLGKYRIPIPVADDRGQSRPTYQHRFELNFELHALVPPAGTSQVAEAWSRHEGKIRDQIIRICRSASVDELQERDFTTLKARLIDVLASQMGSKQVKQLLFTDVTSLEL